MSCRNCDCKECCESRGMVSFFFISNDTEDECANARDFDLPASPSFSRTEEQFRVAMHSVFDQYPNCRIPQPVMVTVMCERLNVKPHEWKEAQDHILAYLSVHLDRGTLSITKGKDRDLLRNGPNASPAPTINDHTCPHCGNTACSKSEQSCWKCGGSL